MDYVNESHFSLELLGTSIVEGSRNQEWGTVGFGFLFELVTHVDMWRQVTGINLELRSNGSFDTPPHMKPITQSDSIVMTIGFLIQFVQMVCQATIVLVLGKHR
jgi:hypothetical protein